MYNKRKLGTAYEELAIQFMKNQGYELLDRNFYCSFGELDAIFLDPENTVVFSEIKYRSNDSNGDPAEAVDVRKQKRICKSALYYIQKNHLDMDAAYRFDVLAIQKNQSVRQIQNAFPFHM